MSHEAIWTQFLLQMQVASDIISSNFADTQTIQMPSCHTSHHGLQNDLFIQTFGN
jgi:hypothetical protein